jgi:hypothetical protein
MSKMELYATILKKTFLSNLVSFENSIEEVIYCKTRHRMKHVLAVLGFVILSGILGLILSAYAMDAATNGSQIEWENIDLPEGYSADHFEIGDGPYLYLRTQEDALLAQLLRTDHQFPWIIAGESPLEGDPLYQHARADCIIAPDEIDDPWIQKPPGLIREQLFCDYMRHAEYTGEIRYVILEDRGLWRWARTDLGMAGLGVFVYFIGRGIIGGAIFGILTYIAIILAYRTIRKSIVQETLLNCLPEIHSLSTPGTEISTLISNGSHLSQYATALKKILILFGILILLLTTFWFIFKPFLVLLFPNLFS